MISDLMKLSMMTCLLGLVVVHRNRIASMEVVEQVVFRNMDVSGHFGLMDHRSS